jgi:hypothetical protein
MRESVALTGVVLLALSIGLAGCTKKGGGKGGKRVAKRGAAGLVGTWAIDGDKLMADSSKDPGVNPEERKQLATMLSKTTLTFARDTITKTGFDRVTTEKYTVIEDKGDTVVLEAVSTAGRKNIIKFTYVSDDEIKSVERTTVVFLKRKSAGAGRRDQR